MTLIDQDGNGFTNVGDDFKIRVMVSDAEVGTSVGLLNNDLHSRMIVRGIVKGQLQCR